MEWTWQPYSQTVPWLGWQSLSPFQRSEERTSCLDLSANCLCTPRQWGLIIPFIPHVPEFLWFPCFLLEVELAGVNESLSFSLCAQNIWESLALKKILLDKIVKKCKNFLETSLPNGSIIIWAKTTFIFENLKLYLLRTKREFVSNLKPNYCLLREIYCTWKHQKKSTFWYRLQFLFCKPVFI